jgi:hypothetical protein
MNKEEALAVLYGSDPRDLTAEGYQEAISDLRKRDPNLARRVERALAPNLEQEIFPLRGRKWHETSQVHEQGYIYYRITPTWKGMWRQYA